MNQIPQRQNEERFLSYLAAMRQLYSEEKTCTAVWTLGATSIAALATGVLAFVKPFTPYITLAALLLVVGEFSFLSSITKRRKDAAKIQELLDCELLELEWNGASTTKPEPKTISAAYNRFKKQGKTIESERLENWYTTPGLGEMPLFQARVACQKENIGWDEDQRKDYADWIIRTIVLLGALLIIIALAARWDLWWIFSVPLPLLLPVVAVGLIHAFNHRKAAERLGELREFANRVWHDASQKTAVPDLITQSSRRLQDRIFIHRSESPPVPDWFYKRYKKRKGLT
ncbi:MAG: S-4TM family putative pore-forming effector [Chloroflexota bacterium]